jgi:hypothetical protein
VPPKRVAGTAIERRLITGPWEIDDEPTAAGAEYTRLFFVSLFFFLSMYPVDICNIFVNCHEECSVRDCHMN